MRTYNKPKINQRNYFQMKKINFLFVVAICIIPPMNLRNICSAQNIAINSTGAAAANASILDVASSTQGLLIPRVSLTDVTVYAPLTGTPVTSLLVFSSTSPTGGNGIGFYYWDVSATRWQAINTGVAGPQGSAGPAGPAGPAGASAATTSLDEDAMVWSVLGGAPGTIGAGGSIVSLGNDSIFALRGGSVTTFYMYRLSTNAWSTKAAAPGSFSSGSGLVFTGYSGGNGYIYALQGSGATGNLYRYDIAADSWATMTAAPAAIGAGGALVYSGGDYIYAVKGGLNPLYRYSISGNSWASLAGTNNGGAGASLVYTGGDYIYAFLGNGFADLNRYSISTNAWTNAISTAPGVINGGGGLVYTGGNYLYATQGGLNATYYRYEISTNTWITTTAPPNTVNTGGCSTYGGGNYIYVLRGNTTTDFWRVKVKGVQSWQPWMK